MSNMKDKNKDWNFSLWNGCNKQLALCFPSNTETFLETQCGEDTKDIGESQAWSHLLKKHYWKRKKIVKFEVLMKENKAMTKLKTIWAWLWNVFHPVLHMHCITVKKYYPFIAQDNTYALWNKPNNE